MQDASVSISIPSSARSGIASQTPCILKTQITLESHEYYCMIKVCVTLSKDGRDTLKLCEFW